MDINILYSSNIISLFTDKFENIANKYKNDEFNWEKIEYIFNKLFNVLSDTNIDENNFIKYYYIFTFIYLNYSNYLVYIKHKDITNDNLDKIIKKIKTSQHVTRNILKFSSNNNVQKIIKLNNLFILKKIKKNKINNKNLNNYIESYINDIKQLDKISELSNGGYKKILNLIIYRFILCKNNDYSNYHNFYTTKIIESESNSNSFSLNFDNFIKQIPLSKKLLNISIDNKKINKININITKIINFILNKKIKFYADFINDHCIEIKNKKIDGTIKINISNNFQNIEFNQYQTNYNFIHYNLEELKEFNFLKKSFSTIEINLPNINLKDLSSVLEFIHLIVISIKIISTSPSDLYECLYPIDYTNYYYDSFCLFFEFIKDDINNNPLYNKFIIDIIKFLFIYSYYDYYFYYTDNLINTLINKLQYKNEIFTEFVDNLKNSLKLPKELLPFPPFFNNDFDINSVIYYNFDMPSYFKFFDFINALCFVLNKKKYDLDKNADIIGIIVDNIHFDNSGDYLNSITKSVSLNNNICPNNKSSKKLLTSDGSNSNSNSNSDSDSDSDSNSNSDSDSGSDSSSDSNSSSESESESELSSNIISKQIKSRIKNKNNHSKIVNMPNNIKNNKNNMNNKSNNMNNNMNNMNNNKNDLESNLDSDIINNMSKENKMQMSKENTYIELNNNNINMSDCILNTEL